MLNTSEIGQAVEDVQNYLGMDGITLTRDQREYIIRRMRALVICARMDVIEENLDGLRTMKSIKGA